ncbi:hypothetical protein CAEBREN_04962 [Caenorhabditis brenneri]|uniref:Uncharacterized protein n=1 Tax=Caenorhabditis brenneri TaxID=135651 RepID=G0MHT4_CAEBE|nr:hypothetical protein CAEBREN_04962 [Caenorhabditis brenneri]
MNWDLDEGYLRHFHRRLWELLVNYDVVCGFSFSDIQMRIMIARTSSHMHMRASESEKINLSNTVFAGIDGFVPLLVEECRHNMTNSYDGPEMMLIKIRHLEEICDSSMKNYLPLSYIEAAEEVRTGLNNMILQLFDDVEVMKAVKKTIRTELIFTSDNVGIFKRAPKFVMPEDPPSMRIRDSEIRVDFRQQKEEISFDRLFEIIREQEEEHYEQMNAQLALPESDDGKKEKLSFRQLEITDPNHPFNKLSERKRYNTSAMKKLAGNAKHVYKPRKYIDLEKNTLSTPDLSNACGNPTKPSQQEEETQSVPSDQVQFTKISKNKMIPGSCEFTSLQYADEPQMEMQHNPSNSQKLHQSCSKVQKHLNFMISNQDEEDQNGVQLVYPQLNQTRGQEVKRTHAKPNLKQVAQATIGWNNKSYINRTHIRMNNPTYNNLAVTNFHGIDEAAQSAFGTNTNKFVPVENTQTIEFDDSNLDYFEMDSMDVIDHEEVVSTTENEFSYHFMESGGNVEQQKLQTEPIVDPNEESYHTFDNGIFETGQPLQTEFLYGNEREPTSSLQKSKQGTVKRGQSWGTQSFSVVNQSANYSEFDQTRNIKHGSFTTNFVTDEFDDEMETVDIEEIPDDGEILFEEPKVDDLFFSADEIEGLLSRKKVAEQATSTVTEEEFARLEEDYPVLFCQPGLSEECRNMMAAFILRRQEHPQPSLGCYFSVKMNETIQFEPKCRIEMLFEMNFRALTWRRLRKTFTYEGNNILEVNEYLNGPKNRTVYLHLRDGPSFESVKF